MILLAGLFLLGTTDMVCAAKKGKAPKIKLQDTLTVEQQQQFLYYFYEVERLIQLEKYYEAKPIVEFCYELNPNDATINNYLGFYAKAEERPIDALYFFKRAFELAPKEYWYNYNVMLLQTGNKKTQELAIKNIEFVAKTLSKDEEVYEVLQKAYISIDDYRKALEVQEQIDSITGYNAMSAMQRYRLNVLLKNNKQAIYEIERYLEIDPNDQQFQVFRMQLYEATNQPPEKLIVAYEAILRFDSRNNGVLNNLAWHLCISGGNLLRAEELSRVTIMREPSNPIYLDTYAWIMYKLGDCESALFYIGRAMEYQTEEMQKEIQMHYKEITKKCGK